MLQAYRVTNSSDANGGIWVNHKTVGSGEACGKMEDVC